MTILLANGDYPVHPTPLALLNTAERVVCCDGAANRYVTEGGTPFAIIGDGDSVAPHIKERCAHCFHPVAEQENNDLTKAVNFIASLGETDITILGATGKRECHTLGNISLLIDYQRRGLNVRMLTDHCEIRPCQGKQSFNTVIGQQISIINFGAKGFGSTGLRYPIYDFSTWWQGTLNEATDTLVTIEAEGEYLVLLDYPEMA